MKLPDFFYRANSFRFEINNNTQNSHSDFKITKNPPKRFKLKFIDKGILKTSYVLKAYFDNNTFSNKNDYLNKISIRIKIIFLIIILLIISFANKIEYQLIITSLLFILSLIYLIQQKDNYKTIKFIKKIIYPTIFLGFLLSFPASFNFITNGEPLINLFQLKNEYKFWVYKIPKEIFISKEGFDVTMLITLRVLNSISASILILQTEPIEKIINGLKILGVPSTIRTILLITQKYIILFSRTVQGYYFSMKSRMFAKPKNSLLYDIIGTRVYLLYRKTKEKFYGTSLAMKSRGIKNI